MDKMINNQVNHITILIEDYSASLKNILGLPNLVRIIKELKKLHIRQITVANWDDEKLRPILKKYQVMHFVHPSVNVPDNSKITLEGECYYSFSSLKSIIKNFPSSTHHTLKKQPELWWQRLDTKKYSYLKTREKILKYYWQKQISFFYFPFLFFLFSYWSIFLNFLNFSFKTYHSLILFFLSLTGVSFFIFNDNFTLILLFILIILKQSLALKTYLMAKNKNYQSKYFFMIGFGLFFLNGVSFCLKENYHFYNMLLLICLISFFLVAVVEYYKNKYGLNFHPRMFYWFENRNFQNGFILLVAIIFLFFNSVGLFWFFNLNILAVVFYYFIALLINVSRRANN